MAKRAKDVLRVVDLLQQHSEGPAEPAHTDLPDLPRRLRLGDERRGQETAR